MSRNDRVSPIRPLVSRSSVERQQARGPSSGTIPSNSVLPVPNESGSQVQPTTQLRSHNELGLTPIGIVLEGRPPGCVLNRDLNPDTLSHILIEDNLIWLGIEKASGRQPAATRNMGLDDEEDIDDNGVKIFQARSEEEEEEDKKEDDELKSANCEKNT